MTHAKCFRNKSSTQNINLVILFFFIIKRNIPCPCNYDKKIFFYKKEEKEQYSKMKRGGRDALPGEICRLLFSPRFVLLYFSNRLLSAVAGG